jgi:rieske iron-sulfur protein
VGEKDESGSCMQPSHTRRVILQAVFGLGACLSFFELAAAQDSEAKQARPQAGDQFVSLLGEKAGQVITPGDLRLGGPQVLAYPIDPRTKIIRDGSRLNQVLLIRLNLEDLSEATRAHAAEGIVAYSAFCTHRGCPVSVWQEETKNFRCPCHDSEFDPRHEARVVGGPARRRLAALPLKVVDGVLMAAGGFVGRVGIKL